MTRRRRRRDRIRANRLRHALGKTGRLAAEAARMLAREQVRVFKVGKFNIHIDDGASAPLDFAAAQTRRMAAAIQHDQERAVYRATLELKRDPRQDAELWEWWRKVSGLPVKP